MREAVPHPRLGRQMHHHLRPDLFPKFFHPGAVTKIGLHKPEPFLFCQPRQPGLLELGIVIVIQIIQTDHGIALLQQPLAQMIPDKSGRPGDQNLPAHAPSIRNHSIRSPSNSNQPRNLSPASNRGIQCSSSDHILA